MSDRSDYEDYQAFKEYQAQTNGYDPKAPFDRGPATVQPRPEGVTPQQAANAAVQGISQGMTFGYGDEITGAIETVPRMIRSMGDEKALSIPEAYAQGRDKSRARLAESKEVAPTITATADVGGSLVSGMGAYNLLKGINLAPKTVLGSAAFGGAEGAINAHGRSDNPDQTMANLLTDIPAGMAFGAGAYGGSELIKRLIRGRNYTPNSVRHQQAEELGIKLTPAQKYMDPTLHKVEAAMRSDPGYSAAFNVKDTYNQIRANQVAAKTMGLDAKQITEQEFGDAQSLINSKFSRAANQGEAIHLDDQWLDNLDAIEADYQKAWGKADAADPVLKDARLASEHQYMTPQDYQFQYSRLGKSLEQAKTDGDGHKVEMYRGMRTALNDVLDRTYPDRASATQEARELYKAKLLLQKPGVVNTGSGDVSPLTLANKLRKDVPGYLEGGNQTDLYNLGRVSQNFKSNVGDSGTATRSKTALDYLLAPARETAGNLYLSGKVGTALTGGSAGGGAISNPMLNALLQSPELIEELNKEQE